MPGGALYSRKKLCVLTAQSFRIEYQWKKLSFHFFSFFDRGHALKKLIARGRCRSISKYIQHKRSTRAGGIILVGTMNHQWMVECTISFFHFNEHLFVKLFHLLRR